MSSNLGTIIAGDGRSTWPAPLNIVITEILIRKLAVITIPKLYLRGSILTYYIVFAFLKDSFNIYCINLKGTISDYPFQTQTALFFLTPIFLFLFLFFCIFRENFIIVITYLYNSSLGNSIILEREPILCCLEIIFTGEN